MCPSHRLAVHEPLSNIIEQECVILEVPSSTLKLIKVKCLCGGKTERAVREMERRETDKACSFLLNGERITEAEIGGGEGKTEKKKKQGERKRGRRDGEGRSQGVK